MVRPVPSKCSLSLCIIKTAWKEMEQCLETFARSQQSSVGTKGFRLSKNRAQDFTGGFVGTLKMDLF